MAVMAFDPESPTPEAEIVSAELQTDANQPSPVAPDVWKQGDEEFVPAIYDSELRPDPGWRSWSEPVQSASESEMPEQAWRQLLLTRLRETYKTICQSAALIAVGVVAALLVVGFAHQRLPLPASPQGTEKARQVPLSKPRLANARRKMPAHTRNKRHLVKSQVTANMAAGLESPVPSSRARGATGKVSLASSRQRMLSSHSKYSSESEFVAKDTVTGNGNGFGPAPK